jgi:DNA-binding response OmpR family regulator
LLARIRLALRRTERQKTTPSVLTVGDMRIDLVRRQVTRARSEVRLTPTEYAFIRNCPRHQVGEATRALWLARRPGYSPASVLVGLGV